MVASYNTVENWKVRAKEMGATHIISVCDTFEYNDYPVFVMPTDDIDALKARYDGKNMQRINEVIAV